MTETFDPLVIGAAQSAPDVYYVCMARLNVHVPDELAARARGAGLNVSAVTQAALAAELERHSLGEWLAALPAPRRVVSHQSALAVLDQARADLGQDPDDGPVLDSLLDTSQ